MSELPPQPPPATVVTDIAVIDRRLYQVTVQTPDGAMHRVVIDRRQLTAANVEIAAAALAILVGIVNNPTNRR